MAEYKIVIGTKSGKSYQKELKGEQAEALHRKHIGEKISGEELGFPGYEFLITGGSDKCGFPMRKGIQDARKKILTKKGIGFEGYDRNDQKQNGLLSRRTVCGEVVTGIIHQVNLKALKEGSQPLGEAAEEKKE